MHTAEQFARLEAWQRITKWLNEERQRLEQAAFSASNFAEVRYLAGLHEALGFMLEAPDNLLPASNDEPAPADPHILEVVRRKTTTNVY